jgi:hypothetical protein
VYSSPQRRGQVGSTPIAEFDNRFQIGLVAEAAILECYQQCTRIKGNIAFFEDVAKQKMCKAVSFWVISPVIACRCHECSGDVDIASICLQLFSDLLQGVIQIFLDCVDDELLDLVWVVTSIWESVNGRCAIGFFGDFVDG